MIKKEKKTTNQDITKYIVFSNSEPDACNKLVEHEKSKKVFFDETHFIVIESSVKIQKIGLTRLIKQLFFSGYTAPKSWKTEEFDFGSSLEIGVRVHRQLHHIFTCEKLQQCDCKTKTHASRLNKKTLAAKKFLQDYEIVCEQTEIPIVSTAADCCTSLDMIGTKFKNTKNARSVIISWKTGYCIDYDKNPSEEGLSHPFEKYQSTPQHHNQIQAILEYKILREEYNIKFDDYYIVYLRHSKNEEYHVERLQDQELYIKENSSIYKYFVQYRQK